MFLIDLAIATWLVNTRIFLLSKTSVNLFVCLLDVLVLASVCVQIFLLIKERHAFWCEDAFYLLISFRYFKTRLHFFTSSLLACHLFSSFVLSTRKCLVACDCCKDIRSFLVAMDITPSLAQDVIRECRQKGFTRPCFLVEADCCVYTNPSLQNAGTGALILVQIIQMESCL